MTTQTLERAESGVDVDVLMSERAELSERLREVLDRIAVIDGELSRIGMNDPSERMSW